MVHEEILLPANAPAEYSDRAILWNAVEKAEKNSNAQLACEIALPVELSREQNISLAREYAQKHFVSAGMCADICIVFMIKVTATYMRIACSLYV